jgi:hypothetical protein
MNRRSPTGPTGSSCTYVRQVFINLHIRKTATLVKWKLLSDTYDRNRVVSNHKCVIPATGTKLCRITNVSHSSFHSASAAVFLCGGILPTCRTFHWVFNPPLCEVFVSQKTAFSSNTLFPEKINSRFELTIIELCRIPSLVRIGATRKICILW